MITNTQPGRQNTMTRETGKSASVLQHLSAHTGQMLHRDTIASTLGMTGHEVSSAVGNLKRKHNIEVPTRGFYIYRGLVEQEHEGPVVVTGTKGEVVAMLNDDRLLVSIEGRLYVASELPL